MSADDKSTIHKFSRTAPWVILARTVMALSGFVLQIVIPKYYADDKGTYGLYSILQWVVMVSPFIFGMGLEKVVPRFLPELVNRGDGHGIRRLLWSLSGALAIALLIEIGLLIWGGSYYQQASKGISLVPYLWVMICLAGFMTYRTLLYNLCVARFDAFIVSMGNIVSCVVWVGLTIWFLKSGYGLTGILWAQVVSVAVQIGIMFWRQAGLFLRGGAEKLEAAAVRRPLAGVEGMRLYRLVVPTLISNIQFAVVTLPAEMLFTFLGIRGPVDTANYGLAYNLSYFALGIFVPPIYTLAVATFSDFYVKDPQKLRLGVEYFYKLLFVMLVPVAMLGIFLGDKAILLLVNHTYLDAARWVPIFSVYHIFGTLFIPISVALVTVERWMVMVPINICQIAAILLLNYLVIPTYGAQGAMFAKFSTTIVVSIVTLWVSAKVIGGLDIPLKYLGKCILACGCIFILYPLRGYVNSVWMLVLISVACCVIMAAAMRLLRLIGPDEARLISRSGSLAGRITLALLAKKRYNNNGNGH